MSIFLMVCDQLSADDYLGEQVRRTMRLYGEKMQNDPSSAYTWMKEISRSPQDWQNVKSSLRAWELDGRCGELSRKLIVSEAFMYSGRCRIRSCDFHVVKMSTIRNTNTYKVSSAAYVIASRDRHRILRTRCAQYVPPFIVSTVTYIPSMI